jgi:hypothetical protein
VIAVPRVAESPVSFECKVTQIIQLQRADGETVPSWLILGEVVAVHIAKWLLKDGIYDTAAAEPILRGGGRRIISSWGLRPCSRCIARGRSGSYQIRAASSLTPLRCGRSDGRLIGSDGAGDVCSSSSLWKRGARHRPGP